MSLPLSIEGHDPDGVRGKLKSRGWMMIRSRYVRGTCGPKKVVILFESRFARELMSRCNPQTGGEEEGGFCCCTCTLMAVQFYTLARGGRDLLALKAARTRQPSQAVTFFGVMAGLREAIRS